MGDLDVDTEEELLRQEFTKWEELRLPHPRDVFPEIDMFHLSCRIDALIELLLEAEVIDNNDYAALIFKKLREHMEKMKPGLAKALHELRIAPNNGTKLFGPDGRPLI